MCNFTSSRLEHLVLVFEQNEWIVVHKKKKSKNIVSNPKPMAPNGKPKKPDPSSNYKGMNIP
jgi:hypothetical protein